MNKQQPEALRLADELEVGNCSLRTVMHPAAAELRRLHIGVGQYKAARIGYASEFPVNAEGLPDVENIHRNIRNMKFMRDELLDALKEILDREWQDDEGDYTLEMARRKARDLIAKATGDTK